MLLPAVAHWSLSLQMSVSPARTLPTLPVAFQFAVDNSDAANRKLPSAAVLIVTPNGRDPFFALAWNSHAVQSIS
jgi:hypothetical protein